METFFRVPQQVSCTCLRGNLHTRGCYPNNFLTSHQWRRRDKLLGDLAQENSKDFEVPVLHWKLVFHLWPWQICLSLWASGSSAIKGGQDPQMMLSVKYSVWSTVSLLLRAEGSLHRSLKTLRLKRLCFMRVLFAQLYLILCSPMHCSPPGSPVRGISQAKILERIAISSSKGSSRPRPPALQMDYFFFSFFFNFFFICSEFCHTLKWNSHGFTCVPHPDPPSHLPLHPLPLGLPSAPGQWQSFLRLGNLPKATQLASDKCRTILFIELFAMSKSAQLGKVSLGLGM